MQRLVCRENQWDDKAVLASTTTDWITAIGSAFAAVGTVSAVVFALWQVRRQDARRMRLRCYTIFRITENGDVVSTVALHGTNTGRRAIRVVGTQFLFGDGKIFAWPKDAGDDFPITLEEGESVEAEWDKKRLRDCTKTARSAIMSCSFTDGLGNSYAATYPGVKVKRKGWPWRRRTEYVPADG